MHTTHFEAPGGEPKKSKKRKFPKWRRTEPKGNVKIMYFLNVFRNFWLFEVGALCTHRAHKWANVTHDRTVTQRDAMNRAQEPTPEAPSGCGGAVSCQVPGTNPALRHSALWGSLGITRNHSELLGGAW